MGVLIFAGAAIAGVKGAVVGWAILRTRRAYKQMKAQQEAIKEKLARERSSIELSFRQNSTDSRRFGYGTARYGGTLLFAHTHGNRLYLIIGISSFQKYSSTGVYEVIPRYLLIGEDKISMDDFYDSTGAAGGTLFKTISPGNEQFKQYHRKLYASPDLMGYSKAYGTAIDTHKAIVVDGGASPFGPGEPGHYSKFINISAIELILEYDNDVYPMGLPPISIIAETRKKNFNGNIVELSNPAECLYDYLTNSYYGMGISTEDIDFDSFWIARGATLAEFRKCHMVCSCNEKPIDIIHKILDTCDGTLVYAGGKWYMFAGVWYSPVLDLNESDFRSSLSVQTRRPRSEIFNTVTGTIINADGITQDVPVYSNAGYVALDGEELSVHISLDAVQSVTQATQIFRQKLERNRHEIIVSGTFSPKAAGLIPGQNIRLTYERYGWDNKYFEVAEYERVPAKDGSLDVKLILHETDPSIFDPADTPPAQVYPATNLPDPRYVAPPTGPSVENIIKVVSNIKERWLRFSWVESPDIFIRNYEVRYKWVTGSGNYTHLGTVLGQPIEVHGYPFGEYLFEVRTKNTLGVASSWAGVTVETEDIPPPENVTDAYFFRNDDGEVMLYIEPVDDLAFASWWIEGWYKDRETGTYKRHGSGFRYMRKTENMIPISELGAPFLYNTFRFDIWAEDTSGNKSEEPYQIYIKAKLPDMEEDSIKLIKTEKNLIFSWDKPELGEPEKIDEVWIYNETPEDYAFQKKINGVYGQYDFPQTNSIAIDWLKPGTYDIYVLAARRNFFGLNYGDSALYKGGEATYRIYIMPPSVTLTKSGNVASGVSVAIIESIPHHIPYVTIPTKYVEFRKGTTWGGGTPIDLEGDYFVGGLLLPAGTTKIWVKVWDILDTSLGDTDGYAPIDIDIPISAPTTPTVNYDILPKHIKVYWNKIIPNPSNQYNIRSYKVYDGANTLLGEVEGNEFILPHFKILSPTGVISLEYKVKAIDIAGNESALGTIKGSNDYKIPEPPTNFVVQVIRNVVFLNWEEPNSTIPIRYYRISRTDAPIDLVYGDIDATAYRIEEPVGGTYTYKVQAIDEAGNISPPATETIFVDDPDGFQLIDTVIDDYATEGTITGDYIYKDSDWFVLGVDGTQTYEEHFSDYSTPQGQISDGLPYYIQPVTPGEYMYESIIDLGAVLPAGTIIFSASRNVVNGLDYEKFEPEIAVKEKNADSWIVFSDSWNISTINFRYIRIRIYIQIAYPQQLVNLISGTVFTKILAPKIQESGSAQAKASDVGGTVVPLVRAFTDISDVVVTVNDAGAYFATATWVDPNPTEIKVFAFDSSNNRVTKNVSYIIRGI